MKSCKKRCLIGLQKGASKDPLKGIFCKSIRRLLEAKRACVGFDLHENNLQTSIDKGTSCLQKTERHANG